MSYVPNRHLCPEPWQRMLVDLRGDVVPCCARRWNDTFGNIKHQRWQDIWNGEAYQKLRAEMRESGYEKTCPDCELIKTQGIPPVCLKEETLDGPQDYTKNGRLFLKEFSEARTVLESTCIHLTIFPSGKCNLQCIQCAQRLGDLRKNSLGESSLQLILDLLPTLDMLCLSGGEPMVQKEYTYCIENIEKFKHLTLSMSTNGILLDDEQLQHIHKFKGCDIGISVDAGSRQVYEKVRRGNWDILYNNILNISQNKKDDPRFFFAGSYTINKLNVLDLCNYITMCMSLQMSSCFYSIEYFPPDLRPDIFCNVDEETRGWEKIFDEALCLAEKFDNACFPKAFSTEGQYTMLPSLKEYVGRILRGIERASLYKPREFSFGKAFARKFVVIVHSETNEHLAYGYCDDLGKVTIRVPSDSYSAKIYDDRYVAQRLGLFHF